jgi:hypothetical protein
MEVEMKNVQSNFNITSWAKVAHQVNQLLNLAVVGQPSGKGLQGLQCATGLC